MILLIDNYDSFTYNIVQYLCELGETVNVVHNDETSIEDIVELNPRQIIISPGPGTPKDAGLSMEITRFFGGKVPIFGVCLGHQCIGEAYGGIISYARDVMHGRTSLIYHNGKGVFRQLPSPLTATRYHSLVISKETLPRELEVTAWTKHDDGSIDEIMAVQHRTYLMEGVQFHPESILSECGHQILRNFIDYEGASALDSRALS